MRLSLLILCIVSMTSFSQSKSLGTGYRAPPDFGLSDILYNLLIADNDNTYNENINVIFDRVEDHSKYFGEYYMTHEGLFPGRMTKELEAYKDSVTDILTSYQSMKDCVKEVYPCNSKEARTELIPKYDKVLLDALEELGRTNSSTGKNVIDLLVDRMNLSKRAGECSSMGQSLQYAIYNLYRTYLTIFAQGYAMSMYVSNTTMGATVKDRATMKYNDILHKFHKSAARAMSLASRYICPFEKDHHNRGEKTYIELKWLFNAIVTNEVYLNEKASCWQNCEYYQNTTFHQYSSEPAKELNICHGRIYNCVTQKVDYYCSAKKSSRRYEGFLPTKMGKTDCHKKHHISKKVTDGIFDKCDQCICYCDDHNHHDTVRKFSLRAAESDASKNRVITGMQFVEKDGTIYLKIRDGKLGPKATIDQSTVAWQPIDEINWHAPVINPNDFFTITYDNKYMNLDTIVLSDDQVLTGIRLEAQGSHLALNIRCHAFNYSTGILGEGHWVSYGPGPRDEIIVTAPNNPLYMKKSVVDTRINTFVTFRMTDLEKDAGQTAIPFIDARPVRSYPVVPLAGAGLYYRGQSGYGGFIGLNAIAYNFTKAMEMEIFLDPNEYPDDL